MAGTVWRPGRRVHRGARFLNGIFTRSYAWRDCRGGAGAALRARFWREYAAPGLAALGPGGGDVVRRQRHARGLDGHTPAAGGRRNRKQGQAAIGRTTMGQPVEKTVDRLSELLDRANKAAQDFEVKDRLSDAVAALRRTRITQDSDTSAERFVTGLLIGVAVGFGLALLLAPKTGEEMRDDLMQRGNELRDRAGELAPRRPFGDGDQGRTGDQPTA